MGKRKEKIMKNLKSILALVLIACLIAVPFTSMADGENIIVNGGFEDTAVGQTPAGYDIWNATRVVSDDFSKSGSNSLKVTFNNTATPNSLPSMNHMAPLESNSRYKLSAWVRLDPNCIPDVFENDGTTKKKVSFDLRIAGYGDLYHPQRGNIRIDTDADFTYIEAIVELNSLDATSRVNLYSEQINGLIFYVDDLECIKLPPRINLVDGGDFENKAVGITVGSGNDINTFSVGNGTGTYSDTMFYEGGQSLYAVSTSETYDFGLNYFLPLKAGKTYEFSAWVRNDPNDTGNNSFYIRMSDTTFDFALRGMSGNMAPTDGWKQISAVYTPTQDYSKARLNISMGGHDRVYKGYIDNVICKVVEPSVTSTNKLSNGSFEMISPLPSYYGNHAPAETGISTDFARTGTHSLKAVRDSALASNLQLGINYNPITIESGKTYRLGAWFRFAPESDPAANLSCYLRFMAGNGSQLAVEHSERITPTTDFTYVSIIYKAAATATDVRLNIGVNAVDTFTGEGEEKVLTHKAVIYLDDITFEEVIQGNIIPNNIINNSSYEEAVYNTQPRNFAVNGSSTSNISSTTKATVTDALDPDYVHSGQYALKVEQLTPSGSVTYKAAVEPGASYKFGAAVRLDKETAGTTRVYINTYIPGETLKQTENITGASPYQDLEKEFTVPQGTTELNIQIKADTGDGSSGKKYTYYIDDVYLVKTGMDFERSDLIKLDGEGYPVVTTYTDSEPGLRGFTVYNINNNTSERKNIAAVIVVYSGNKIEAMGINPTAIENGANIPNLGTEVNVPSGVTDFKLKTFIWDTDTLTPFTEKPLKLLFVGNSITHHAPKTEIGWTGSWGMAATSQENDYVHKLTAMARLVVPDLVMDFINISPMENDLANVSTLAANSTFKPKIDAKPDIIIFTFGANASDAMTVANYKSIVDAFNPQGKAKVIIGTTTLTSPTKLATINSYAATYNKPLVVMSDLTDPMYKGDPNVFTDPGVLSHPGDLGMLEMANRLYPELVNAFNALGKDIAVN